MECVDARTGLTTTYKGIWRADQLEGLGRIKFPNGDSFKGMLKNGQPNGHGELKQGRMGKAGLVINTFFRSNLFLDLVNNWLAWRTN